MKPVYWWTRVVLIALLMSLALVRADNCPFTVKCSIDGQMMMQEETYYNGMHKSIKYSHDYNGPNGKEHHFVIVSCD